mgnify:CR=1 FL=1
MIHIYIMYLPIAKENGGRRTGQKHRTEQKHRMEHEAGTKLLAVGLRERYGLELNTSVEAGLSSGSMGNHICGITREFILTLAIVKDWWPVHLVIRKREWMLNGSGK